MTFFTASVRPLSGLAASVCLSSFLFPCAVVAATNASATQPSSPQSVDVAVLKLNQPISRALAGNEVHTYKIRLEQGQVGVVTVEQRGIDVAVQLVDNGNKLIAEADDEITGKGTEKLPVVADHSGDYAVVVKPKLKLAKGEYEIRFIETHAASQLEQTLFEVRKLRTAARQLAAEDKEAEALPLTQHAVDLAKQVLGPKDAMVALAMKELAEAQEQKNVPEGRKTFSDALQILIATLGPDHPQTLQAKARLASTCVQLGELAEADRLLAEVMEAEERILAPNEPLIAHTLLTRGIMHWERRDFAHSEQDEKRALAIFNADGLTEQYAYGELLNNLGALYSDWQKLDQASQYLERALQFDGKKFGPESFSASYTLNNLGIVARQQKNYPLAEQYLLRALAIKEKLLGKESGEYSSVLMNLANVYRSAGDYRKALETYLNALEIAEKVSGPYEGRPIRFLANIVNTYAALGDFQNANNYQAQLEDALETYTTLNLTIGSETSKLAYIEDLSQRTDRAISLNLQLEPKNPQATALATTDLLRRKARLLDSMTDLFAEMRKHADAHGKQLLDQLKDTTTQFAQVALRGPRKGQPLEEHRKLVQELQEKKEKLEAEISRENEDFRSQSQPVTLAAVESAIPRDAALLEFVRYRPFNVRAQTNAEQYGTPRYAVYVLTQDAPPKAVDLGPADVIDREIQSFRAALRDPERNDVRLLSRNISEEVLHPILSSLGREKRLLVSPDGQLDLIPFQALIDSRDRYLVERYSISYLTTGRDLLRMEVKRASKSPPMIVADPVFGENALLASAKASLPMSRTRVDRTRSITSAADLSGVYFAPLAGTREEARNIQALFPNAKLMAGAEASKAALESVAAPSILHIATHGFFLQDPSQASESSASSGSEATRSATATAVSKNPLLRSGLALSGANAVAQGNIEGILTALEASHLDLWGTKLVTLSACDTGLGEVRNGEGVYGFRRAFFLAGAESQVTSLWPVSDYFTREMMTAYYKGLKRGLGRGEALHQAQLAMMNRAGRRHPFYWASFIQIGEWANLAGQR